MQKDKYVETHSEGDEPYRKVVITLKPGVELENDRRGKYSRNNRYSRSKYNRSYKNDSYERKEEEVQKEESTFAEE